MAIDALVNGESGLSARAKLNLVISTVNNVLTPQMIEPNAGDGTTDAWPAIEALLAVRQANGKTNYPKGPTIFFPAGKYNLASVGANGIQLKAETHLMGDHGGMGNAGAGSELIFPADCAGIVVNRYNTLNNAVESPTTGGADGSSVRRLVVTGGGGTSATAHGIWLKARAHIENVTVQKFAANGINIVAGAGTGGASEGNANDWFLKTIRAAENGLNGIFCDGADANSGVGIGCSAVNNGRYGIYDSSFLGNTWVGCHTATNGVALVGNNASGHSSFVHYGGIRYAAHPGSTEAAYVATTPGTDATVWVPIQSGSSHPTIPTWTAAQSSGTFFAGGAFRTEGGSSANLLLGCYAESGQGASDIADTTLVMGGSIYGAGFTRGGYFRGDDGNKLTAKGPNGGYAVDGTTIDISLGIDDANGDVLKFSHSSDNSAWPWRLRRSGSDWVLDNANSGSRIAMRFTGENTSEQMGTGAVVPYVATFPKLGLGSGSNVRLQTTGSAAPSTGAHARGEIVWNVAPSAAGYAGWICTTAGTPGTWKQFGAIEA